MELTAQDVLNKFKELYPGEPLVVRSPGRINLIGEHTDYNDGFVMPAAIDRETVFAIAESVDGRSEIYSIKYNQTFSVDLRDPKPVSAPAWVNYLLGVLRQFVDKGYSVQPFRCVFGGNIPMGAGLSSSASVECGFAFALNVLNHHAIDKKDLIKIAQWSEHHFVGVKCGIMDQFASMMGSENHVILLDCRSLEYRYSPLELKDFTIVLCDSKVKHSLVDSEYNTRRNECEQGVAILKKYYPAVNSLRDVSENMVLEHKDELKGKVFDRCLYIVQEIARVQQASRDLENHDLQAFGKKMFETHEGLSKLYEVSCPELDFLVDEAKKFSGVLGARVMGGGFGGCTINLVKKDEVGSFLSAVRPAYAEKFGIALETYIVNIKDGTSVTSKSIEKINLL
ncbi:galactokinase [Ohtaekwangia sp.]|uniref:galactokinase n=1 Tax=Ohtaekwangia sp. TaxID=2066019 RepID=UPI002F9417FC